MYAQKMLLLDLDELIKKDKVDLNEFYEETVKEMSYDGETIWHTIISGQPLTFLQ